MNQLKNLQKIQIGLTCGVLIGVWTNLFVNLQSSCPHFRKCPVRNKTQINSKPITDIDEIKKIFNNN